MNKMLPVSTIMTRKLETVNPEDLLVKVKKIFDDHNIHHIPVVRHKEIVGIISKSDFLYFLHGFTGKKDDELQKDTRLTSWKAEEIMTKKLAKVESTSTIRATIELFKINWFHAIPVVDNSELVGIVSTHDIINKLAEEPIKLEDYQIIKT